MMDKQSFSMEFKMISSFDCLCFCLLTVREGKRYMQMYANNKKMKE